MEVFALGQVAQFPQLGGGSAGGFVDQYVLSRFECGFGVVVVGGIGGGQTHEVNFGVGQHRIEIGGGFEGRKFLPQFFRPAGHHPFYGKTRMGAIERGLQVAAGETESDQADMDGGGVRHSGINIRERGQSYRATGSERILR